MARNKNKKRIYFLIVCFFCMAASISVQAGVQEGEGEYEIYPTPQEITYGSGTTTITERVEVSVGAGVDAYARQRIDETLDVMQATRAESSSAANTRLLVGIYGSGDAADQCKNEMGVASGLFGVEKRFDVYSLWISNGRIVVLGEDSDAVYYGLTTLKHIFAQIDGRAVRNLTVKDYAQVEFRGFIEGYYGNPWSHEDRIDIMEYGGEIKLNQYVYAPKDDPLHNARWRDLYDEEGLEKIRALAQAGNENKCFFVYALHTFMNNPVNLSASTYDSELQVVKAKFEQVIRQGGVRQIAILEDDARGESAENMIRFLNDMHSWLVELKQEIPDLKTDLLYCPTCYMNTTHTKMTTISQSVSKEIHLVVTGGKIWGEVSETFATNFYNGLGGANSSTSRYPYMWVNWPCNDNTKDSQIMGGHNYILHTGVDGSHFEGIILNPIQESESSKVGIFTAADYAWKIWQNEREGDQAWEDSFQYIDHMTAIETEASLALKEVAKHQIAQSAAQTTAGKQTAFEESVELKPQLESFLTKLNQDALTNQDMEGLKREFQKIHQAADLYLQSGANRRMASQMTPFFSCLRDVTQAADYLMDALKAKKAGNEKELWDNYFNAQILYEQSKTYGFHYYNAGTLYAKAGRKYIEPFTSEVLAYVAKEAKQIVSPENVLLEKQLIFQIGGGHTVTNATGTPENAIDGNIGTAYVIRDINQIVGDYVGLSFNRTVPVTDIQISLATSANPNGYFYAGTMEYTQDGEHWVAFADNLQPQGGPDVNMTLPNPVRIKGFRWKCTALGTPSSRWLVIRNVGFNMGQNAEGEKYNAVYSRTPEWQLYGNTSDANMTDGNDTSEAYYHTVSDYSEVGDYIQIDLQEVKPIGRVRAIVGGSKDGDKWTKYHLEYSLTGAAGSWTSLPSYEDTEAGPYAYEINLENQQARYLRLVNDRRINKWVIFCEFAAYSYVEPGPAGDPMDYTNTKDQEWRVEYGEEVSKILPKENVTLQPGEYIGLRLSRIRAVTDIEVSGTNLRQLALETSLNKTEWKSSDQKGAARYIRLMNQSSQPITFGLDSFLVHSEEIFPMDLLETTIGGSNNASDARYLGATKNWMDGDLSTAAKYCAAPVAGSYVTYDLGQEINLSSLRMYVLDTAIDYPRDAKIQASVDNVNWTDILTIGDGVQNPEGDKDAKPVESDGGNWIHDNVNVAYAYVENANINNVKARYLRLYFTAAFPHRWVEVNEILINNGQFIPEILDPTFETNAQQVKGYEIQNVNDGDLTTAFWPKESDGDGYLVYHLSDTSYVGGINIVQSGSKISNAVVSVRTGENTWETLGRLDSSFCSFDTTDVEAVYAIKIEWSGVTPMFYEIATLIEPKLEKEKEGLQAVAQEIAAAEAARNRLEEQVAEAERNVSFATDEIEKLRLEIELQNVSANYFAAEALLAEKKALEAEMEAKILQMESDQLRASLKYMSSLSEKNVLSLEAEQKEEGIFGYETISNSQKQLAEEKKGEQNACILLMQEKQKQLDEILNQKDPDDDPVKDPDDDPAKDPDDNPAKDPDDNPAKDPDDDSTKDPDDGLLIKDPVDVVAVTEFSSGDLHYKVIDAAKGTVALTGTSGGKKITSLKVPGTVSDGSKIWKVEEIQANAWKGDKKLKKVTIGANVKVIGAQAFAQCKKLKTINLKKAANLTSVGKKAFSKISAKATIKVPKKALSKYKKLLKKAGAPQKVKIK